MWQHLSPRTTVCTGSRTGSFALNAPRVHVARTKHTQAYTSALVDTVRQRDYAAYLTHVAYARRVQPHFWALRAFQVELATIKDTVSNELVGRIRMQWWRDAIESIYAGRPPKHPIAQGLYEAISDPAVMAHGSLVKDHFLRIIDAREADLADPLSPPTLEELEKYAEATSSRMLYLLLNLQGLSEPTVDMLFSHLGKAIGLTIFVASLPYHTHPAPRPASAAAASSPRSSVGTAIGGTTRYAPQAGGVPRTPTLPLPLEYILEAGVTQEDVFRHGPGARGLKDAVFYTATRANDYLITARRVIREELGGRVPALATGPMLLAVQPRQFLRKLERVDFNPYDPTLAKRDWLLPWHMWIAARRQAL